MGRLKVINNENRVIKNVPISGLKNPYLVRYSDEDWTNIAHFHLISKEDDVDIPICMFINAYYDHKDNNSFKYLSSKQCKELYKFLLKINKDTKCTNWEKISFWYQDEYKDSVIEGIQEHMPKYNRLKEILIDHHLSNRVKIGEFEEYDVVVYKERMLQPHFHLISRIRDFNCPIQLFRYSKYLYHPGTRCNYNRLRMYDEVLMFDRWLESHWIEVRDKFIEVNHDHYKQIIIDAMMKETKPCYVNLYMYDDEYDVDEMMFFY